MSLSGSAVLAIWHNLIPEGRDEFHEWHTREHMPERLGVAGFIRGRRYLAIDGEPDYFNLYETTGIEVLSGADYLSRLNSPTAWTRRVVPYFRDISRSICRVAYTGGVGQGGVMLTQRLEVAEVDLSSVDDALRNRILPRLVTLREITGVHFCLADEAVSRVPSAEAKVRGGVTHIPDCIVLIEGIALAPVQSAGGELAAALLAENLQIATNNAMYQLQFTCSQAVHVEV